MKNKEIEELLNDMRHSYEIHEEIIKKYNNADKISYPYTINLKQIDLLLSYIEQLEKKVDQYENPDDLTLFYIWLDTRAKDKMKQMENEITNLKQQNQMITELGEQLENKCESLLEDRKQLLNVVNILQNNRDKAIEILERHSRYSTEELLNILKGGNNDR